jgi:nitroimidazol reductase NimA-like FMN-containing flavoprotein (pyridoxamine 5'-phosphate oxidase superfamily)
MEEISLNARTFSPGEFEMLIHEMTEDECGTALEQAGFGRLACVRGGQPYIVPIYFSYDRKHLYGVTTLGQKIEWMRSNPLVCLEIDERTSHYQWMSVIAVGRYEELRDTPEYEYARAHALEVLQKRAMWWQPASVATEKREQRPPIFYRIHIEQVTGHRATPDAIEAATLGAEETLVYR